MSQWRRFSTCCFVAVGCACLAFGCAERLPDPANELPFGFVDVPANGAAVARVVRVAGWALDDVRVARVDVYVNGRFRGSTMASTPRPDVANALAPYARQAQTSGWEVAVDLGEGSEPRTVLAQAVDDRGATRDIGIVTLSVAGR